MTTTTKTLIANFLNARRVSTPLLIIRTTDAASVAQNITSAVNGDPVVQWDAAAGFQARNKGGQKIIQDQMGGNGEVLNPSDAFFKVGKFDAPVVVLVMNAHRVWSDLPTMQAIWNLRDSFKADGRTFVMLTTPEATAPRELESDTIVIDDPLPSSEQLREIVETQCNNAGVAVPKGDAMRKATDALKGLSTFVAEQIAALALRKSGVDMEELWQRKIQTVQQTPGATVYTGGMRFADIGGHEGLKRDLRREINSRKPVKLVVILDEFEKMIAGASSDHVGDGGVAKDAAQVVLTYMQDHDVRGLIAYGHPGTGKTALAKAMSSEADCLCIQADMGAMKGGIVGESEARVRAFFNLISAIAGDGGAFFFATCNSTGAITTELRRRFKTGFYFVDLPTREEKDAVWAIHMKRYELKKQALPNDDNWTGAEIEVCCEKAHNYDLPLVDVAGSIIPVAVSTPELIEARRREAHNRLISSQTGRAYEMPGANAKIEQQNAPVAAGGRKVKFN